MFRFCPKPATDRLNTSFPRQSRLIITFVRATVINSWNLGCFFNIFINLKISLSSECSFRVFLWKFFARDSFKICRLVGKLYYFNFFFAFVTDGVSLILLLNKGKFDYECLKFLILRLPWLILLQLLNGISLPYFSPFSQLSLINLFTRYIPSVPFFLRCPFSMLFDWFFENKYLQTFFIFSKHRQTKRIIYFCFDVLCRLSQLCRRNSRKPFLSGNKIHAYGEQAKHSAVFSSNDRANLGLDGIRNYNRKEWTENSYQFMDSVWHRLKVIQVNKNLLQKEVTKCEIKFFEKSFYIEIFFDLK